MCGTCNVAKSGIEKTIESSAGLPCTPIRIRDSMKEVYTIFDSKWHEQQSHAQKGGKAPSTGLDEKVKSIFLKISTVLTCGNLFGILYGFIVFLL